MKPRLDTLKAILIDHLVLGESTPICETTHLYEDLGADSLDVVEIIMAVEETFDVAFSEQDESGIQTVAEILHILETHLGPETP